MIAFSRRRFELRRTAYKAVRVVLGVPSRLLRMVLNALVRTRQACALRLAFEPRDSDIFIVTYPKAGTTLLQMMLYQLTSDGSMDIGHIDAVVPWLESALAADPEHLERLQSPRLFKTHLTLRQLPKRGKFVYLVRSPKDSCISYYHHRRSLHADRSSLPQFVDRFIKGRVPMGSWFAHLEACAPYTASPNVLTLTYEAVCGDLPSAIASVAEFCGIDLPASLRERVAARCSIEFMRRHNAMFDPRLAADRPDSVGFIRRGQPGKSIDELDPLLSSRIDDRLGVTLKRLAGYRHVAGMGARTSIGSRATGTVHSCDEDHGSLESL